MNSHATVSAVDISSSIDLRRSAEWLVAGSIDEVRDALVVAVRGRGGRVEELESDGFEASFGSRLAYGLGGVLLKASRERLPMKARVALTPARDSLVRVAVTFREDDSRYGLSVDWRDRPYRDATDRLLADLRRVRRRSGITVESG